MKHRIKTSFKVKDKPEPRKTAAVMAMAKKLAATDKAPCPTHAQVAELAVELAREEHELGPPMEELFYWPPSATPCQDPRRLFLPIVEKFKKKAEEQLRLHFAYHHALSVRRQRWLRAHPRPRGWAWTRRPLRRPATSPRRCPYRPPWLVTHPDASSPPRDSVAQRPRRRESERILCYDWLFDNSIVIIKNAA